MDDARVSPQSKGQNQSPLSVGLQRGPPPSYGYQIGQSYTCAVAFIGGCCLFFLQHQSSLQVSQHVRISG